VTPLTLQRKRALKVAKKSGVENSKKAAAVYAQLKAQRSKEQKEARRSAISKRRSSRKSSKTEA